MRGHIMAGLFAAMLPWLAHAGWFQRDWPETLAQVRDEFPSARQMGAAAVAAQMNGPTAPLLLDVRTPEEYAISQLRGAILAPDLDSALRALAGRNQSSMVIVYCSVGWRSSRLAQALQAAGYGEVYNLEGGLFTWANEDRPVYQGDRRVRVVHPYNDDWGKLLRADWHPR